MNKIKVLIVDDSAVMRTTLTKILSSDREIEVVGTALDPFIAVNKIKTLDPDVLTLDIEMPRMDGLTFLTKLMVARPMPVIMVSSLTDKGTAATMKAMEIGAVDVVLKPDPDKREPLEDFAADLIEKIKGAYLAKNSVSKKNKMPINVLEKFTADVILPKVNTVKTKPLSEKIIAIGASTGGTEVIAEILAKINPDIPGILIVQHMPEKFTEAFANRVNGISRLYVKEAVNGDRVYSGQALVAPGNRHMLLVRDHNGYKVEINDGPPVNRHRPSVDVLFRSVAQQAGRNATGIILTGMGDDGAAGLLEMHEAESATIAQDEKSCCVFGMPRMAIERGAASMVKNIGEIIEYLNEIKLG